MQFAPPRDTYKGEYLSSNMNTDGVCFWVIRVEIDDEGKFVQENTEESSMLILYELPYTVLEYMPNKMILALSPADMLITENWEPIRHIPASSSGNIEKNYIARHPDFDEDNFPFLVCSGV